MTIRIGWKWTKFMLRVRTIAAKSCVRHSTTRMEGSQILATTFATYSDVIEEERFIDMSIASDPIEPSFACEHSSQRSMLKRTEDKDVNNEKEKNPFSSDLS